MALTVPPPRSPLADDRDGHGDHAQWYERELGWATTGTAPVRLLTGLRFDVLELPAVAGHAALRRVGRTGPVALTGQTMGLLVARAPTSCRGCSTGWSGAGWRSR